MSSNLQTPGRVAHIVLPLVLGLVGGAIGNLMTGVARAQNEERPKENAKDEIVTHKVVRTQGLEIVTEDGELIGWFRAWGGKDGGATTLGMGNFSAMDEDHDSNEVEEVQEGFRLTYHWSKEGFARGTGGNVWMELDNKSRGNHLSLVPSGAHVKSHLPDEWIESAGISSLGFTMGRTRFDPEGGPSERIHTARLTHRNRNVSSPVRARLELQSADGKSKIVMDVPDDEDAPPTVKSYDKEGKVIGALAAE